MAKAQSKPVYLPKHRIAGGVVLILIAVVVIPLLLREPVSEANAPGGVSATQSQNDLEFRSRIKPANGEEQVTLLGSNNVTLPNTMTDSNVVVIDSANKAQAQAQVQTQTPASPSATVAALQAEAKDTISGVKVPKIVTSGGSNTSAANKEAVKQPSKQVVKQANKLDKATPVVQRTADLVNGWTVRIGTFANTSNAQVITKRLLRNGYDAKITTVDAASGKATRVWIGPFAERAEADRISAEMVKYIGEKGYVTKHAS